MKMEIFKDDDDDGGLRNEILAQMVGSPRLQDWPPQTAFPKPTLLQKEFFLELFFLQFHGKSASRTKTFVFILQLMSILNFQSSRNIGHFLHLLESWLAFVIKDGPPVFEGLVGADICVFDLIFVMQPAEMV